MMSSYDRRQTLFSLACLTVGILMLVPSISSACPKIHARFGSRDYKSGDVKYEVCFKDTTSFVDGLSLKVSPFPLQRGATITPSVAGMLHHDITSGWFSVDVKSNGADVFSYDFNLCEIDALGGCPLPAGPFLIDFMDFDLPSDFPLGAASVEFQLLDQNFETRACIHFDINVVDPPAVNLGRDLGSSSVSSSATWLRSFLEMTQYHSRRHPSSGGSIVLVQ